MKNNCLLALSLIVLLTSACKKDAVIRPADITGPGWQIASGFTGNITQQVNNSMIFNDQLYALTFNTIAEVREDGSAMHFGGVGGEFTATKVPFTPLFIPNIIDEQLLGLSISPRPNNKIRVVNIDSLVTGAKLNAIGQYQMAASNNGQLFLIASNNATYDMPVLLNVEIKQGNYTSSVEQVKRISVALQANSLNAVNALDDHFLLAYFSPADEPTTALVAPDGSYQVVANGVLLTRVFKVNNTWYAFGRDLNFAQRVYRSTNEGKNWQLLGDVAETGFNAEVAFIKGYAEGSERSYLYTEYDLFSITADDTGKLFAQKVPLESETRISTVAEWRNNIFVMGPEGVQFISAEDFELLLGE